MWEYLLGGIGIVVFVLAGNLAVLNRLFCSFGIVPLYKITSRINQLNWFMFVVGVVLILLTFSFSSGVLLRNPIFTKAVKTIVGGLLIILSGGGLFVCAIAFLTKKITLVDKSFDDYALLIVMVFLVVLGIGILV